MVLSCFVVRLGCRKGRFEGVGAVGGEGASPKPFERVVDVHGVAMRVDWVLWSMVWMRDSAATSFSVASTAIFPFICSRYRCAVPPVFLITCFRSLTRLPPFFPVSSLLQI